MRIGIVMEHETLHGFSNLQSKGRVAVAMLRRQPEDHR